MEADSAKEDSMYGEVGNYFFNNEKLHDVEFIVGEEQKRIKAIKSLLINQSKVWWSMLSEDSPLAEKGDIHLPDIEPEVFSLLLKHSYGGLESLVSLSNEIVMKLCYCANKYDMKTLMTKIAARLDPKDVDGLFPALHCLAYYNLKGVEDGVQKIIRTETTKIFEHPEFLECDVDSVTYICKQETLNCDELTLWKAVVDWAKHKAGDTGGAEMKQWMAQPLQHIRLMSLSVEDFHNHVLPLDVLTREEIVAISRNELPSVPTLCGNQTARPLCPTKFFVVSVDITHPVINIVDHYEKTPSYRFHTKGKSIELMSILCRSDISSLSSNNRPSYCFLNRENTWIDLKVLKIRNLVNNTFDLEPTTLELKNVEHYIDRFAIPTTRNNKGIILEANSEYKLELSFSTYFACWTTPECIRGHEFAHGTFYCSAVYDGTIGISPCHILQFTYRVADN